MEIPVTNPKLYLAVAQNLFKRRLGMLGRQTIKKELTSPGESPLINGDSPSLYSGTFKRFATIFPSVSQMSP